MKNRRFCYFTVFARRDQRVALKQMKSLVESGIDVTMVVSDGLPDDVKDGIKITSINVQAQIGSYMKRLLFYPVLFFKKFKQIDADVYQTCDVDSLFLCLLLKKKGKRIVFNLLEEHPYTLYDKLNFPPFINKMIVGLVAVWMKFVLRRVDAVYTVAQDIEDYLKKWGLKNTDILGNYPEVRLDHCVTLEHYLSRPNRIIYFGAIYAISRQDIFLNALQKCPGVTYLLAGDFGVGHQKEMLEKHPMWDKIIFKNRFKREELDGMLDSCTISNVLRDFSCTGYPNGSNGIIKLYESMEAALPIICSDVKIYREMMKEYPCGILVDINDEEQIVKAINYLVEHKEEAYKMGQNGRRAVLEKYNWQSESRKYVNMVASFYDA